MTILFTADIHIKLHQKNVPVTWAKNRYLQLFNQIETIALKEEVDLIIVGGDVFDRTPTLEELELFFTFVKSCRIRTLIYDGNHESTKKNDTFMRYLAPIVKECNKLVTIITEPFEEKGKFSILPYCELHKSNSIEMLDSKIPLFTHVRGSIPPHVKPEVDLNRFSRFPIVFAGDLHSHSNTQLNIVYPGSPVTTTFHRGKVDTGIILIENDWDWCFVNLKLPQLLRYTVKDPEDMKPGEIDHIIYELEGDMQDLVSVKPTDLLDKKIVKRNVETTLILDKDMSISDELREYLAYILELSDEKVDNLIGIFNDYTSRIKLG